MLRESIARVKEQRNHAMIHNVRRVDAAVLLSRQSSKNKKDFSAVRMQDLLLDVYSSKSSQISPAASNSEPRILQMALKRFCLRTDMLSSIARQMYPHPRLLPLHIRRSQQCVRCFYIVHWKISRDLKDKLESLHTVISSSTQQNKIKCFYTNTPLHLPPAIGAAPTPLHRMPIDTSAAAFAFTPIFLFTHHTFSSLKFLPKCS